MIVYHAHNVEYLLRKARNGGTLLLWITRLAERALVKKADLATAVSQVDANAMKKLYGRLPSILPNGVDVDLFRMSSSDIKEIKNKYQLREKAILFMGLTEYPPNKEAIDALVNEIFPRILKRDADVQLAVIGGKIEYRRPWLLNPGSIPYEDIPAFISACQVCVAPIRSGSGTRLKILEYMAANRPVVSTPKGAEGLDFINAKHLLIADSNQEFADAILCLLQAPGFAANMSQTAYAQIQKKYSWQIIASGFANEIPNQVNLSEDGVPKQIN